MIVLEATMQTLVTQSSIAVAVTWKLSDDLGDHSDCLISVSCFAAETLGRQSCRQIAKSRSGRVISRNRRRYGWRFRLFMNSPLGKGLLFRWIAGYGILT